MVLPSVNAIINFANEFFEMFTKKQSRHPHQVFQVFQVFHVRFWTTKPPDFGPNPNKHVKPIGSSYRHIMATENTQKANSPTGLRTRYCPVCNSRSSFSAKRFFSGGEVAKRGAQPAIGDGVLWGMWERSWLRRNTIASGGRRREDSV